MILPLETLPPGDPSGGVVYLRIVLSLEKTSRLVNISGHGFSRGGVVSTSPNPQASGPPLISCPQLLIQYEQRSRKLGRTVRVVSYTQHSRARSRKRFYQSRMLLEACAPFQFRDFYRLSSLLFSKKASWRTHLRKLVRTLCEGRTSQTPDFVNYKLCHAVGIGGKT